MPGIQVFCDRGGTFCDVIARVPDQEDIVIKLLSHDPANYKDAPTEGIRRVLERSLAKEIKRGDKIDTSAIDYIRLSTTVATNALLERKGEKHVLVTTKGFRDLLEIGNQSRPDIFALNIRKPEVLYSSVLEVDERVTLVGYASDPHVERNSVKFDQHGKVSRAYRGQDHPPPAADVSQAYRGQDHPPPAADGRHADIVQGESGEAVAILKKPDEQQVEEDLKRLYDEGYRAAAIVLMHSYTYPEHERIVEEIAKRVGFTHISVSSKLMPMIKIVPRGTSSTADAYLTPILKQYIDGFFNGFQGSLRDGTAGTRVEFMMSDGGLTSVERFSGLKSIISGPAGGVVGMALTSYWKEDGRPIIGLDMGGTSTQVFETTLAGVTIQSPQLDINTVASGGSSRLFWRNGLFVVGPESASAHPGPTCYRKGGPLAITDANLVTGRLPTEKFPKIFGPKENESLDEETSRTEFEKLREEINKDTGRELSLDETAQGFIRIANELMARPIRALTEARGYSASKHILACFGGAGGQHACSIARSLGIKTVLIHKYSSILSAYGMALANRVHEAQAPSSETWGSEGALERVQKRVEELQERVKSELHKEGFKDDRLEVEILLNLRLLPSGRMGIARDDEGEKEGSVF
ncbi:related to 5-oxoprolinase [Ceraceosorus bombacis]|uniref:Related to 5-oxoprolinase n=1 Tax=Ceraceosorus bombacis TaxID=401625 RepID=A0A0N7L9D2_9BASI|nr:related to 5-oxoprolinase [Ceraceosorus bombacis]